MPSAADTPAGRSSSERIEVAGRSLAYTGDGEYTQALAELVADVDLPIAESYFFDKPVKWHLNYPDIARLNVTGTPPVGR